MGHISGACPLCTRNPGRAGIARNASTETSASMSVSMAGSKYGLSSTPPERRVHNCQCRMEMGKGN